jgi:hypothetical protein
VLFRLSPELLLAPNVWSGLLTYILVLSYLGAEWGFELRSGCHSNGIFRVELKIDCDSFLPKSSWLRLNGSGFVGLVISMLASGTRVRGFKPGQSRRIFSGEKNPQHTFLRKGSKAVCPMSQIFGMLNNPVITWKLGQRQNSSAISRPISSLANRGLWRLRGVECLWSWRKELRSVNRGPAV